MKKGEGREKIIYECKEHWMRYAASIIICAILLLSFFIMLSEKETRSDSWYALFMIAIIAGITYIKARSNQLVLTDIRVYGKTGIFKTQSLSSPVAKVQTVNIETGLLGRILGYSDLTIHCITGVYCFKKMKNAREMQNAILNQIN